MPQPTLSEQIKESMNANKLYLSSTCYTFEKSARTAEMLERAQAVCNVR
jgi:hypothetical protein